MAKVEDVGARPVDVCHRGSISQVHRALFGVKWSCLRINEQAFPPISQVHRAVGEIPDLLRLCPRAFFDLMDVASLMEGNRSERFTQS